MAGERIVRVWILSFMYWTQGEKVNIALRKHAWTTLGNLAEYTADKAVDGDSTTTLPHPEAGRTCFHAASSPSDWTVDLGQEYQLYDIKVFIWIWTSTSWITRTANSIIYLDNNTSRVCYTFPPATAIWNNPTDVICNDTARNVTIRNPGTGGGHNHALNLCEVEIYGCSSGTYGINCTDSCHCATSPCDRWTGVCSGDCVPGYRGDKCDTICSTTTYGVNCREKCTDRKCNTNMGSCDRVTGSCDTGCLPGWKGADCTEECENQFYGSNCTSLCADRYCDGSSSCNHVTGSCDKGCKTGWEGTDCKQVCSTTTYGVNCREKCTDRKCNTNMGSCDRVTGSCDTGCLPGWKGTDCTEECEKQFYGSNCSSLCADRNCYGSSSCNHVTGSCDKGCKTGWEGTDCKQACDIDHYGPACTGVCVNTHCEGNSSCSSRTGQCDGECQAGWTGIDCMARDRDHYGPDCTGVCVTRHCEGSSTCSTTTGKCDGGCQTGWTGIDCSQKLIQTPPGLDQTVVIVGSVTAVVVIIFILGIIGVIVWRRRRKRRPEIKMKDGSGQTYYNAASESVKVKDEGSEVSPGDSVPEGHYASVDDYDVPVAGRTYEKLNPTSRDQGNDYTGFERSYENVKPRQTST